METLSDKDYVKIALWLDDPYGDGIRRRAVREPSAERLAAITFVKNGQTDIFGLHEVYLNKGKEFYSDESNHTVIKRQHVLN